MPFFTDHSKTLPSYRVAQCGECGLWTGCESPKMEVSGEGRLGVLVVGEAPGADEDRQGVQFVGETGRELRRVLRGIDVDLDKDCWKTNALICRPKDNRTPTKNELSYCRPNILQAVRDLNPKAVLLLGASATRSLLTKYFREDVGNIGRWVGWKIPLQSENMWVCPTWHPSYVCRSKDDRESEAINLWFSRHLEGCFEKAESRPWEVVPKYEEEIHVEKDVDAAARLIRTLKGARFPVSVDYETNRLKPDAENARIYCCALSWKGRHTIVYPWAGEAIEATRELLTSDVPKIGANNKFEDRWTRKMFGEPIRNWVWDTMLSAHHLDCRKGITSVKFQAFVRLGFEPWDHDIKRHLHSTDDGGLNNIHLIDPYELMVYCGLDALVEYKLAQIQRREMINGRS